MVTLDSYIHTISPYISRLGGPRYRVVQFVKLLNKFLYRYQEENMSQETVLSLFSDGFLSSKGGPLWAKSMRFEGQKDCYVIIDENGMESEFAEGTEILVADQVFNIEYKKIENIKKGDYKVIPFYKNSHFVKNPRKIKSISKIQYKDNADKKQIEYESITSIRTILKQLNGMLEKHAICTNNEQELFLSKIVDIKKTEKKPSFKIVFHNEQVYLLTNPQGCDKINIMSSIRQIRPNKYANMLRKNMLVPIKKDKEQLCLEENHHHK